MATTLTQDIVAGMVAQFRAQEGTLFQSEDAVRLYDAVRRVVEQSLTAAWMEGPGGGGAAPLSSAMSGSVVAPRQQQQLLQQQSAPLPPPPSPRKLAARREVYATLLTALGAWCPEVQAEEVGRAVAHMPDINKVLDTVVTRFVSDEYATCAARGERLRVGVQAPKIACLLRSMFRVMVSETSILDGSFFSMGFLDRDLIMRAAFRTAFHAECLGVVYVQVLPLEDEATTSSCHQQQTGAGGAPDSGAGAGAASLPASCTDARDRKRAPLTTVSHHSSSTASVISVYPPPMLSLSLPTAPAPAPAPAPVPAPAPAPPMSLNMSVDNAAAAVATQPVENAECPDMTSTPSDEVYASLPPIACVADEEAEQQQQVCVPPVSPPQHVIDPTTLHVEEVHVNEPAATVHVVEEGGVTVSTACQCAPSSPCCCPPCPSQAETEGQEEEHDALELQPSPYTAQLQLQLQLQLQGGGEECTQHDTNTGEVSAQEALPHEMGVVTTPTQTDEAGADTHDDANAAAPDRVDNDVVASASLTQHVEEVAHEHVDAEEQQPAHMNVGVIDDDDNMVDAEDVNVSADAQADSSYVGGDMQHTVTNDVDASTWVASQEAAAAAVVAPPLNDTDIVTLSMEGGGDSSSSSSTPPRAPPLLSSLLPSPVQQRARTIPAEADDVEVETVTGATPVSDVDEEVAVAREREDGELLDAQPSPHQPSPLVKHLASPPPLLRATPLEPSDALPAGDLPPPPQAAVHAPVAVRTPLTAAAAGGGVDATARRRSASSSVLTGLDVRPQSAAPLAAPPPPSSPAIQSTTAAAATRGGADATSTVSIHGYGSTPCPRPLDSASSACRAPATPPPDALPYSVEEDNAITPDESASIVMGRLSLHALQAAHALARRATVAANGAGGAMRSAVSNASATSEASQARPPIARPPPAGTTLPRRIVTAVRRAPPGM